MSDLETRANEHAVSRAVPRTSPITLTAGELHDLLATTRINSYLAGARETARADAEIAAKYAGVEVCRLIRAASEAVQSDFLHDVASDAGKAIASMILAAAGIERSET